MCGRFTQKWNSRDNIAPSEWVTVTLLENGVRVEKEMRWGLIPSWAKDPSIANKTINARVETIREKPSFRDAVRERRCLIPADGFYEWQGSGKTKQQLCIKLREQPRFSFAGLWDRWLAPNGKEVLTFTIITKPASPDIAAIHERMPVILVEDEEGAWLEKGTLPGHDLSFAVTPVYGPNQTMQLF